MQKKGCYWESVEARDAANHAPVHKRALTTKDYPVQNGSGAKVGETMVYTLSLRLNNQETDLGSAIPWEFQFSVVAGATNEQTHRQKTTQEAPGWLSREVSEFGSGHDLMICGLDPHIGPHADSVEPAWDSVSPPLSLPLPHSPSLKINK